MCWSSVFFYHCSAFPSVALKNQELQYFSYTDNRFSKLLNLHVHFCGTSRTSHGSAEHWTVELLISKNPLSHKLHICIGWHWSRKWLFLPVNRPQFPKKQLLCQLAAVQTVQIASCTYFSLGVLIIEIMANKCTVSLKAVSL